MGSKVVFTILHYCAVEITIEAVEKIRELIDYENYEILITDNGSPDGSGELLKNRFQGINGIYVIQNRSNLGFAQGNNQGYGFAREKLKADFIIVMNNDVMIEQGNMVEKVLEIYKTKGFYVLGPDIVTRDESHQNPHRIRNLELRDVNRIIRNRTIILLYLKLKHLLRLEDKIQIVEKWDCKRGEKEKTGIDYVKEQEGVVLQGSFLVFSPDFIQREEEAFFPETFMWMEEEILTYLCKKKGYKILFSPAIRVIHKKGSSTKLLGNKNDIYYTFTLNIKHSATVFRNLMKKNEGDKSNERRSADFCDR